MAGVTYPLEEIDRMEAARTIYPEDAARLRASTMEQMATIPAEPRPEGYEMVEPRTVSSQPQDVGSELVPPEQVSSEYRPEQVDPETGYEMVNPLAVSSRALTKEEYDELRAAHMAQATPGDEAESAVRAKAQNWYSDMSRKARGITGRGDRAIGELAEDRAGVVASAQMAINEQREKQWAAEERLAGVYDHRRELVAQSREWLTKREERRAEVEQGAQADVEFAMREREYWNYAGDDLGRDLALAKEAGPEGDAARERLAMAKQVDPRGGIFSEGWSTVLASIAMAMGAFGSALAGGPNAAMQIINKAVDRNINAQLEKKRGAREKLTDQERKFDKILSRFDDGTERNLVARSMMLQEASEQAAMYSQQASTADKKAGAEQLAAQLADESLRAQQEAWQRRTTIRMQGWDAEYKIGHMQRQMAAAQAKAKAGKLRPTPNFMMEKFGSMRTVLSAIQRGRESFKKVEGIRGVASGALSKATGNMWNSEAALYDADMVEIGQLVTKATQGARPSDKDMEFTLRRVPAFYENNDLGLAKLDAMERSVIHGMAGLIVEGLADGFDYRQHYNEFVKTHGVTPEDVISGKSKAHEVDRSIFEPGTAKEAPPVVGGVKGAFLGNAAYGPLGAVGGAVAGMGGPEQALESIGSTASDLGRQIGDTWENWGGRK